MSHFQRYECTHKFRPRNSAYFSINIYYLKIMGGVTAAGVKKSET